MLKTLKLTFRYDLDLPSSFSSFLSRIPTNALMALKLEGKISTWSTQTNGIHFPALSILTLMVTHMH